MNKFFILAVSVLLTSCSFDTPSGTAVRIEVSPDSGLQVTGRDVCLFAEVKGPGIPMSVFTLTRSGFTDACFRAGITTPLIPVTLPLMAGGTSQTIGFDLTLAPTTQPRDIRVFALTTPLGQPDPCPYSALSDYFANPSAAGPIAIYEVGEVNGVFLNQSITIPITQAGLLAETTAADIIKPELCN